MHPLEFIDPLGAAVPNRAIPAGYVAIPIDSTQSRSALQICVLAKLDREPAGGTLVVLRDQMDARVYLGCIVDGAKRILEWVELAVQTIDGFATSSSVVREILSNKILDERWQQHGDAIALIDGGSIVITGFEKTHPRPTWLDLTTQSAHHSPTATEDDSNSEWRLCTDDSLLQAAGLPPYRSSLTRYLYQPKAEIADGFREATSSSFLTDASAESILRHVPFNPAAGLMLVRRHRPLSLEQMIDVLSGAHPQPPLHGRSPIPLDSGLPPEGADGLSDPWLFTGRHGSHGRILETFHLKLRLVAEAVSTVSTIIERIQRPLLNLTIDHLRIELGHGGAALPRLWTARTILAEPGCAVELPIRSSDQRYFLQGVPVEQSIYLPGELNANIGGRASVRIRKVIIDVGGGLIIEGTLATQERMSPSKTDIVQLRVNVAGAALDLHAHLEAEPGLARGEWRFRTPPLKLTEAVASSLRSMAGIPLAAVPFEIISLLSSPCDLYSLAVIAVRTLLVDAETTLPIALDEIISLAREVAHRYDPTIPIRDRISAIFDSDPRWNAALGAGRLSRDLDDSDVADTGRSADLLPPKLWWDTMAMIVTMLPGIGPDSICSDLGDARPGALHRIFDRVLADLNSLLIQTRSLIVIDWRYNREIYAMIRHRIMGLQLSPSSSPSSPQALPPARTSPPAPVRAGQRN